jgi:hypothetical protein
VIVVVAAIVMGILVLERPSSSEIAVQRTSQSESENREQVIAIIPTFVGYIQGRNIQSLSDYYTSNSTVLWAGTAEGLQGIYSGQANIRLLYVSSLSHMDKLEVASTGINATSIGPNVSVSMNLYLNGHSSVIGNLSAMVEVTQLWSNAGGNWTIQNETWNYVKFESTNPGTATVFPQWGLSLEGKNPDLSSEHVLEWDAAPYVAAGIYGMIVGISVLALLSRRRK